MKVFVVHYVTGSCHEDMDDVILKAFHSSDEAIARAAADNFVSQGNKKSVARLSLYAQLLSKTREWEEENPVPDYKNWNGPVDVIAEFRSWGHKRYAVIQDITKELIDANPDYEFEFDDINFMDTDPTYEIEELDVEEV